MADPVTPQVAYGLDVTGEPVKGSPEMYAAGVKPISPQQAEEQAQALANLKYADEHYGEAGKFGLGALSGLSLGIAPGALAGMGVINPGGLAGAQVSPLYTAGDVAGMMAPALLSGGESLAAEGMALTPAGLMTRAGGMAERVAAGMLPESAGLLGKAASVPIGMAARGATEGALINIGHTIGDNLLQNKPLSAEALWASGQDGALAGGLLGAGLGTVGALGGLAVEGTQNLLKRAGGGSGAKGVATAAKSLGGDFAGKLSEDLEGNKTLLKNANEIMEKGGTSFGDTVQGKIKGISNAENIYRGVREEAIADLEKSAPGSAPSLERLQGRFESTIVGPRALTPGADRAEGVVSKFIKGLTKQPEVTEAEFKYHNSLKPLSEQKTFEQYKAAVKDSEPMTWKRLVQARDQLAEEVGKTKANPLMSDKLHVKAEILNALDDELRIAAEDAGKLHGLDGIAEKYGSATANLKLAQEMKASLGAKYTNELLSPNHGLGLNTHDATSFAFSSAMGHPVGAVGILAAKSLSRQLQKRLEPWMAQMAYNNSIGTKAAGATLGVKQKIGESLGRFFKQASKAPYRAAQTIRAERSASGMGKNDRAEYEAMASRAEQLVSNSHQERVRMYAQQVAEQGYQELAQQLMATNARAVQYAMYNMPARQGTKGATSLRKMPVSKTLTMPEFKASRMLRGIGIGKSGPLAILDDMENGNMSTDQVRAMKYVYPELHGEIVAQATQQIYEMKVRGDDLPMDKIYALGAVLGEPIDRTLQPDYVNAVQMALATPQNPEPAGGQSQPQNANMSVIDPHTIMTPLQKVSAA